MSRKKIWVVGVSCVGSACLTVGYLAGRAGATGIPASNAMTYGGVLVDASGQPIRGTRNIEVALWDAVSGGTQKCSTNAATADLDANAGVFQVPLAADCTKAVHDNVDLWVEIKVGGDPLPRTKLGAVPYAVEAQKAVEAQAASTAGPLADRLQALEAKEPFAGTYPAVVGLGGGPNVFWGGPTFCGAAPASLELSSSPAAPNTPRSNGFGSIVFTNGGKLGLDFTNNFTSTCSTANMCAAPVTFFLKSPVAQTLSISAWLDDNGALYLNGAQVGVFTTGNSSSPTTLSVNVPQGPFSLSFLACSVNGPSFVLSIYDAFLSNPTYNLSVDYDRTFHRKGN